MTDILNENNAEEFVNIVSVTDEEGNEVEFEFIDMFDYEGKEYVVLLPVVDDGSGEVVILEVEVDEDEMETYYSVEDEAAAAAVFELFKEKYAEEFNFVD